MSMPCTFNFSQRDANNLQHTTINSPIVELQLKTTGEKKPAYDRFFAKYT